MCTPPGSHDIEFRNTRIQSFLRPYTPPYLVAMYINEAVSQALHVVGFVLVVALLALFGCHILALLCHERLRTRRIRNWSWGRSHKIFTTYRVVKTTELDPSANNKTRQGQRKHRRETASRSSRPTTTTATVGVRLLQYLEGYHWQDVVHVALLPPHLHGLGALRSEHHLSWRSSLRRKHWSPRHTHRLHHGQTAPSHRLHHRSCSAWRAWQNVNA